jgi:hypothetical protein
MTQWMIKNFHKDKAVIINVATKDNRVYSYWGIPNGQMVKTPIGTFTIDEKTFLLNKKRIANYYYNSQNLFPFNLNTKELSPMTPVEFTVFKEAEMARQLYEASGSRLNMALVSLMIGVISLLGLGAVYYLLNEKIVQILEILKLIGGIA